MKYEVTVNKRFSYIKSYRVLKSMKKDTNRVSQLMQSLIDKYVLKKQGI